LQDIDWDKVELDYRAGALSLGSICNFHNITRQQLMGKVSSGAWTRDLMSQVRAEVNERLFMSRQREEQGKDHVAIAAQVTIDVVMGHRRDIRHLREIFVKTLDRINEIVEVDLSDPSQLEDSAEVLRSLNSRAILGRNQGVVGAIDTLASAYQRIIALERQAFGLDSLTTVSANVTETQPTATVQLFLPVNHRDPMPV
jgi:hypothetical protein